MTSGHAGGRVRTKCVEWFSTPNDAKRFDRDRTGCCGRVAKWVVSIAGDPWSPKCDDCMRFYNRDCVRRMTWRQEELIFAMQAKGAGSMGFP